MKYLNVFVYLSQERNQSQLIAMKFEVININNYHILKITFTPCKITVSHGENKEERRELIKRIFLFCVLLLQGDKKLILLHLAWYF